MISFIFTKTVGITLNDLYQHTRYLNKCVFFKSLHLLEKEHFQKIKCQYAINIKKNEVSKVQYMMGFFFFLDI